MCSMSTSLDPSDEFCRQCATPAGTHACPYAELTARGTMLLTELREALAHVFRCYASSAQAAWDSFSPRRPGAQANGGHQGPRTGTGGRRHRARAFRARGRAAAMVSPPEHRRGARGRDPPHARTPYFVMQLVEGETLDEAFPGGTPAAAARAQRVIGEIAAALAAAHAHGLVPATSSRAMSFRARDGLASVPRLRHKAALAYTAAGRRSRASPKAARTSDAGLHESRAGDKRRALRPIRHYSRASSPSSCSRSRTFIGVGPMAGIAAHLKDAAPSLTNCARPPGGVLAPHRPVPGKGANRAPLTREIADT